MDSDTTALLQELSETRQALELERGLRIAAEALAGERRIQLEMAQKMVSDLSAQLAERFRSLDAFATKILDQRMPEKPPVGAFRMDRLPGGKVVASHKQQEPTPAQFYKNLQKAYGGQKPDAQKFPAVAAAIEKMAEEQIQ